MVVRAPVLTRQPMQLIPIGKAWVKVQKESTRNTMEDAPYTGLLGGIEESPTDPIEHDADGTALAYELQNSKPRP